MTQTKKKKLSLRDFTRCNPGTTRRSKNKCLPSSVYSNISKKLKVKGNSGKLFESVGCQPGEEHCLLDKAPIDENLKKGLRKQYLRPRRPKSWDSDPDMWLDNYNIIHVMKQYEEAYSWFKFLGVFPIDFSAPDPYKQGAGPKCLYQETCELNLKEEYAKGRRGIAMIFNLDPHFKGGSHWVALYINIKDINKPFVGVFRFLWLQSSSTYRTPNAQLQTTSSNNASLVTMLESSNLVTQNAACSPCTSSYVCFAAYHLKTSVKIP